MSNETPRKRRRWRWRTLLGVLALFLVVGGLIAVFVIRAMVVPTSSTVASLTSQAVPVEQRTLAETVQVNGSLEPRDNASVNFPENARVNEVLVKEGDNVKQGDILARLETRDLELAIASRTAQLDEAQQSLDKLLAGPTEAERAKAEAQVARARANLAADAIEVRAIDVQNARTALQLAQDRLKVMQNGEATDDELTAEKQLESAQEALVAAQVGLDETRDSASLAKTQAQQRMDQGAQELEKAQRTYSDAKSDWEYVQRTGRHPREKELNAEGKERQRKLEETEKQQFQRALDDARTAMQNAEIALQNFVEAFDQAREDEVRAVQKAERSLVTAQRAVEDAMRDLDEKRGKGRATAVLQARKEVADAEKAYNDLVNNPVRPAQRSELEAALLDAIATQKKLSEGSDPVDIAKARTALEEAKAALAKAEADLDEATLRAPIAGVVVDVSLKAGTITTSNTSIEIADLESFLIRGNVTEQNVALVRAGQPVSVTIDAVPGEAFGGTLLRVSELPEQDTSNTGGSPGGFGGNQSGALGGLYPVEIVVATQDERLRVGMATTANIELFSVPNAIVVPLQAVEQRETGPVVHKVTGEPGPDGQQPSVEVPVELGQTAGDSVQILNGLQVGDTVLLQQLPPPEGPQFGPGG